MKQYIVDAFTDKVFSGNPAAVCVMDEWVSEDLMKNIAKENNFSETAFAVKKENSYHLRWFTPNGEIDLCGHATLATAFVISNFYDRELKRIVFNTLSGDLIATRNGDVFELTFPAYQLNQIEITEEMTKALGARPLFAYIDRDLLLVMEREDTVKNMSPDFSILKKLDGLCIGVTAKSTEYDCVSRVFAPKLNVDEDPVTGSTHCMIIPYWATRLNKSEITAFQASDRGGVIYGSFKDTTVVISGKAALFAISDIVIKL